MNRLQVVYLHVCVVLTTLTGIVFAAMKYLMKPAGDFSVINHPLQPYIFSAHVVLAPFLLFGLGWLFGNHIWPRFRSGEPRKRTSGLWSMSAIVPMALSGYLLQISTLDAIRQTMAAAHWMTSAVFVIAYVAHWISRAAPATDRSGAEADAVNVPYPT